MNSSLTNKERQKSRTASSDAVLRRLTVLFRSDEPADHGRNSGGNCSDGADQGGLLLLLELCLEFGYDYLRAAVRCGTGHRWRCRSVLAGRFEHILEFVDGLLGIALRKSRFRLLVELATVLFRKKLRTRIFFSSIPVQSGKTPTRSCTVTWARSGISRKATRTCSSVSAAA